MSLTNDQARTYLRPDEVPMWDALTSPDAVLVSMYFTVSVRPDRELRKMVGKDGARDAGDRAGLLIRPLSQSVMLDTARTTLYRLACARAGVNLWPDEVKS